MIMIYLLTTQELLHGVRHPLGPGDHVADVVSRFIPQTHAGHELLSVATSVVKTPVIAIAHSLIYRLFKDPYSDP